VEFTLVLSVDAPNLRVAYRDATPPIRPWIGTRVYTTAVALLPSHTATFVVGQILAVDGGFVATGIGLPALRR